MRAPQTERDDRYCPPLVTTDALDPRDALLETGLALASELSLPAVLTRIVGAACALTSARYGALGVLGPHGTMAEFITHGLSERQRRRIGALPAGRGILGVILDQAHPLRLADISADPRAVGFPPQHPPMTSFLGAPVIARGRVFGNLYLTEKRGAPEFNAEDERALTTLASQAGVAIANASLYEEALSRERWLAAAQAITNATISGSPIAQTLSLVAESARKLLDGESALIALPTGQAAGRLLRVEATSGQGVAQLGGQPLLPPGSQADEVLRTGRSIVTPTTPAVHPRAAQNRQRPPGGPAILVGLTGRNGCLGVLSVIGRSGQRPAPAEAVRMIESFAAQAAVALEYARAQGELQRLVLLDERERIAKELHDGVIQSLFAVGMGLQAISLAAGPAEVELSIERAVGALDQVMRDLRNYIFGLRPDILADRPLGDAVRLLAMEFEARSGLVTTVKVDDRVADGLVARAPDLVQMIREALSNVSRHAKASSCQISLRRLRGRAILTIEDDGEGFVPSARRPAGQGLRNMEERAARLRGTISVRSEPQGGTIVRVVLPLE